MRKFIEGGRLVCFGRALVSEVSLSESSVIEGSTVVGGEVAWMSMPPLLGVALA